MKEKIERLVEAKAQDSIRLARDIWSFAELSYEEFKSAAALKDALEKEGFTIEDGIAGITTAFTASFVSGSGKPVMALLAEYDALDGLSQKGGISEPEPLCPGGAGHGCGHNLLGAGSYAAAVALKELLLEEKRDGTVIFFGCPAEEGAGSKQFIARAGYFDKVDFAFTWHPATVNHVVSKGSVAIMGANFTFDGISAHAGGAPHMGRSALDAVELMNVGVNYLREHMIDSARIHYAYSDAGGTAPNVVQSHAVIKYEVRAPKVSQAQELFTRVVDIAKGAALMTGTKMQFEITMAFSDYTPNKTLAAVMDESLREIGAPCWDEADYDYALRMLRSYSKNAMIGIRETVSDFFDTDDVSELLSRPLDENVHPFDPKEFRYESGSTDVGDVGYATPTVMLYMATACLGNVDHTWQNTSFSYSDTAMKGMLAAAKVMALSCVKAMEQPELIQKARAELERKNGGKYVCPLPEYTMPPIGKY